MLLVPILVAAAVVVGAVGVADIVPVPAPDPGPGPAESPSPHGAADEPLDMRPAALVDCVRPDEAPEDGGAPPPGGIRAQVRWLSEKVEEIRELRFQEPVEARVLDPDEAARRVRELFLSDYTASLADAERRMLSALGVVSADTDLREARARALAQQVAGFYLPETGELVVAARGSALDPVGLVTLAHELEHALADQNLTLPVPHRLRIGQEDENMAALAVIEGDATMTMQRYALTLPIGDQLDLLDPSVVRRAGRGLEGLPHFLTRELLFPYETGLAFACHRYADGGWEAVDAAYARPPDSTAEILFPGRYPGDEPVDPPDPASPGGGWNAGPIRSFGAANLLWLLEAPGDRPSRSVDDPMAGVAGWAGGEVHLWTRGDDSAVALVLAERPGHDVTCIAVSRWYAAAFPGARPRGSATGEGLVLEGGRQDAVLRCAADLVQLTIAPDVVTARSVGWAGQGGR